MGLFDFKSKKTKQVSETLKKAESIIKEYDLNNLEVKALDYATQGDSFIQNSIDEVNITGNTLQALYTNERQHQ